MPTPLVFLEKTLGFADSFEQLLNFPNPLSVFILDPVPALKMLPVTVHTNLFQVSSRFSMIQEV